MDNEINRHKKLWTSVIECAKMDLRVPNLKTQKDLKIKMRNRDEVLRWIDTTDFKICVELAGLDYETTLGEFRLLSEESYVR